MSRRFRRARTARPRAPALRRTSSARALCRGSRCAHLTRSCSRRTRLVSAGSGHVCPMVVVSGSRRPGCVRVAAAGDLHCRPAVRDEIAAAFTGIADRADVVMLAGDLTSYGTPEEALILADACRGL